MKHRVFLLLLLVPALAQAALDFGRPATQTPYDQCLQPAQQVIRKSNTGATMEQAREWMRQARGFFYVHTTPIVPNDPEVTEQRQAGDCKDKSLWLAKKMGDRSVRFVIGKAEPGASLNHAWLLWRSEGRWWILDPTNTNAPIAADTVSPRVYVALYSCTATGKYAHGTPSAVSRVAERSSR